MNTSVEVSPALSLATLGRTGAALAAAIAALAAMATLAGGPAPDTSPQTKATVAAEARRRPETETPKVAYFLIDTQDQVIRAFALLAESAAAGRHWPFQLVDGSTPAGRAQQEMLLRDAGAAWGDQALLVFDLRDDAQKRTGPYWPAQEPQ
jgi:hypothetical protein